MAKQPTEFWVTNISKMNVSLGDLGITIPAGRSMNLLDKRHCNFTLEQLVTSTTTGSLFTKRRKVVVRKFSPTNDLQIIREVDPQAMLPSRRRSTLVIENTHHRELDISDDVFLPQDTDTPQ